MESTKLFINALCGGDNELDDWLECNTEKDIRDILIPIVEQRDELLSTLKLLHSAEWMVSNDCNESRAQIVERVEEVLAKYGE